MFFEFVTSFLQGFIFHFESRCDLALARDDPDRTLARTSMGRPGLVWEGTTPTFILFFSAVLF